VTRARLFFALFTLLFCLAPLRGTDTLPSRLTDDEYWKLVSKFSEPDGSFLSDNYVSNERSYQDVFDDLAKAHQPASAYIGVGPEQNFTYILALKPRIAFIVDIRRQNLIEHLMYKALFELSSDRAEFLSRLFSREIPRGLDRRQPIANLLEAFGEPSSIERFEKNLDDIEAHLIKNHGFTLTSEDQVSLQKVLRAFRASGPSLTYNGPGNAPGIMPGFGEIVTQTARDGVNRGFLATEPNYQAIRDIQQKNLIVPVVGDFAGPHALRSVGEYLTEHNASVSAFYTSNVEQYLFQSPINWMVFYRNVERLPVISNSIFIRGVIVTPAGELSPSPVLPFTSHYETGLFSIPELVDTFRNGSVQAYSDIVKNRL